MFVNFKKISIAFILANFIGENQVHGAGSGEDEKQVLRGLRQDYTLITEKEYDDFSKRDIKELDFMLRKNKLVDKTILKDKKKEPDKKDEVKKPRRKNELKRPKKENKGKKHKREN